MYILILLIFPCFVTSYFRECTPCDCIINNNMIEANCDYYFNKQKLKTVPQDLDPEIQVLHFKDQILTKIEEYTLSKYNKIEKIDFNKNVINNIANTSFKNLIYLIDIDLSNNLLTELHENLFSNTINLKYIWLNNNKLLNLPSKLFSNLKYLKEIHLQQNSIKNIAKNSFFNVPQLSVIDLSKNSLEILKLDFINDFSSITHLILHDNPWNCDNNLCELQLMSFKNNWLTTIPKCYLPQILRNQFWKEIYNSVPQTDFNILTVVEGEDITISCNFDGCNEPKFKWIHEIEDIRNGHLSSILLKNVNKNNEGNYKCIVDNCLNCEQNINLKIIENMKKGITTEMENLITTELPENNGLSNLSFWLIILALIGIAISFCCLMMCCPCCQICSCCLTLSGCLLSILTRIISAITKCCTPRARRPEPVPERRPLQPVEQVQHNIEPPKTPPAPRPPRQPQAQR